MAPTNLDSLAHDVAARWGPGASRPATARDEVDGTLPLAVLEPPDATILADMVRWANLDRTALIPRGGGTKLQWGARCTRPFVVLSTTRLRGVVDHCAGDLTASVAAGTRLVDVNAHLARERQRLALDPLSLDRATIGGIVATNDSGPRRHLHGTPRDLVIGVELALADGRTVKAGGRVVKNVAGYDLARLMCGSFGSLAVVSTAIFKLAPLPPASCTVVAEGLRAPQLADLALEVARSTMAPSSIEIVSPPSRLLIRFETTEAAARQQASTAQDLCAARGAEASTRTGDAESQVWREHAGGVPGGDTLVRLAVLPTQVAVILDSIERMASELRLDARIRGRAALGVLDLSLRAPADARSVDDRTAAAIGTLRRNARAGGGTAVVAAASPALRALVDPWGDVGDARALLQAVKARLDPHHILNPGRGVGGI